MPTWVLAVLALAFLAALTGVALAYTHHRPEQEIDPWQPEQPQPPASPTRHP